LLVAVSIGRAKQVLVEPELVRPSQRAKSDAKRHAPDAAYREYQQQQQQQQ
jgi:hypothetical protein